MSNTRSRAILFFCLLAILAGINVAEFQNPKNVGETIDFPSFYYGSKLVFEDGLTPYNNSNWKLIKPEYTQGELSPFLYPPPSLLIFRPFIFFDYAAAKTIMLWLNHLLILLFVFIFFFKILKQKPQDSFLIAAVIYLYAFFPLFVTLDSGQVSLWVLLSICLTWWAAKEKAHPIWIALPLVFGIVLKFFPILLLAIFFFKREYKTITYVIILLVAVCAIATLFLPDGIWQDWYTQVGSQGYGQEVRGMPVAKPANQSINAFTARLFYGLNVRFAPLLSPPAWAAAAPYVLAGLVGLISVAATWWIAKIAARQDSLDLQFSIWLLAIFLVSPLSWHYHLVHLLPAVYIAVLEALKRGNRLVMALVIGLTVFLAYNFPFNDPFFREGARTLLISSQLYAVGFLWLYLTILAFKDGLKKRSTALSAV